MLLTIYSVSAETYHTTLLTVNQDTYEGGTADLYLEIKPGSGRIFIDTFPISKLDTQFSTRFANDIACDFLDVNCEQYDFFYTIKADSSVVGGPSAGAAIAMLTIGALDHQPIAQDVAMTGTINSGSLIGPVAGILGKASAAEHLGLSKVLIPGLASLGLEEARMNNLTLNDSINYSSEYDKLILENLSSETFEVIQVYSLYDALPYFINKKYPKPEGDFEVDAGYSSIMKEVSDMLCAHRNELLELLDKNETILNITQKQDIKIKSALDKNDYYSAASHCFSQGITFQKINLAINGVDGLEDDLREEIFVFEEFLNSKELNTISDIETMAIVKERLIEAKDVLEEQNLSVNDLAYAMERFYSAKAWSEFFRMDSKKYVVDELHLQSACYNKLGETEEKVVYVESFLPEVITNVARDELRLARIDSNNGDYSLCLFKAAKAAAEANILSGAVTVTQERLDDLIQLKLSAVESTLNKQDNFPIMGYSYYEYSKSLDDLPYSALTFAEYALELSNLHIYFPEKRKTNPFRNIPVDYVIIFAIGFFGGILFFSLYNKDQSL